MALPVHYHTEAFPPNNLDWGALVPHIGPASIALARYDGVLSGLPNPNVLLVPLRIQEAVVSSRIEGTKATLREVYEVEAGQSPPSPERRDDVEEILNYRRAMYFAENRLEELPLSLRVIRDTHRKLLSGVRGKDKAPGEFRRIPNWIGPPGSTIEEAKYVPVGADRLQVSLDEWERYIHADTPDVLVQAAIIHAEFEAIHPFLDGNGSVGRILIPLFLWQRHLLKRPVFYISAYFDAHRDEYYDRLLSVSRDDDWTGWCRFFLTAIKAQAEDNLARANRIRDLYESMKLRISEATQSRYAIHVLDWIFQYPIFPMNRFAEAFDIPPTSARRVLNALIDNEMLSEVSPSIGRRPSTLVFWDVLDIAEGGIST